jgi:uncharacterized membrane protein YeaQ/YmgE (transglycosylase-associated protein family)
LSVDPPEEFTTEVAAASSSGVADGRAIASCPKNTGEASMEILSWIVFGLIVGVIAKILMPGRDPGGFIVTTLLGIAGALVGGFMGRAIGFYDSAQSAGWLMSILGSVILLALYRMMVRRQV